MCLVTVEKAVKSFEVGNRLLVMPMPAIDVSLLDNALSTQAGGFLIGKMLV